MCKFMSLIRLIILSLFIFTQTQADTIYNLIKIPNLEIYKLKNDNNIRYLSAKGNFNLNYGSYGLKAMEPERITSRQIESARKAITRHLKRAGRMWIRIFPDVPVSKKPAEVRMGKGKGSNEYWACRVKPGRIMFEVDGVSEQIAKEALYKASAKLPIKTKFIKR